jgi:DNA-binding NarL/FixJ family response regulator
VLVCDGPVLLAWVGGFREKPYTIAERERLAMLVPSLRRRLRLERQLGAAALDAATAVAALDAIPAAAFVTNDSGGVVYANRIGRALLARDRSATRSWLAEAIRHERPDAARTTLATRGAARHFLVTRVRPADDPDARADVAASRWGLSARQTQVLSLLARGSANKTIAATLGCTEATIEIHVTAILRKVDADNRAELVARFWTEL